MAGRPAKPTVLKALAGTLRADRTNPAEPQGKPQALPEAPTDLSADELTCWREYSELIDPMRIATKADLAAFRSMVECAATLKGLRRSLHENYDGKPVITEVTKTGEQLRIRPEIGALSTYHKLMLQHFSRWGLTPSDRHRVSTFDDGGEDDGLSQFKVG